MRGIGLKFVTPQSPPGGAQKGVRGSVH